MSVEELAKLQHAAQQIHASPALVDYVQALATHTRRTADYVNGLSPRATLALLHAARAWALMAGRGQAMAGDVRNAFSAVVRPRPGSARGSTQGHRDRV